MKARLSFLGMAFTICLGLILSTSILPSEELNANNGTDVHVSKNNGEYFLFDEGECNGGVVQFYYPTTSTLQVKNGNVHIYTGKFDLSGYCQLPSSAEKTTLAPGVTLNITPNGNAILKIVWND